MGSKLKMKAPKKNRVLECDNQMSQAFARAMQNSRKELEIMQDQAYNDGSIFAHLPYSYIKINPPRKYSDEAKEKAAERLNKMRAEKSNTAEEDPFCL